MKNLSSEKFFDLSNFKHAAIFNECRVVWDAIGKINSYLSEYKNFKIDVEIPAGAYLIDRELISIGKGTVIEPGAYIKGPCIIGENCVVRHGAYIRGDFIAGDYCVIGHATEVKSSIMLNHAHAAHFAYLGNSILGNHVNLGAGTKCANLKLDGKKINLLYDGNLIETGLRKFGSILGDGCQLGCNSVTNPGTIFEKNVFCYPCTNVGGYVLENSVVMAETKLIVKKRKN
jgi:NDP-sugar pyrophosphorylase family protein